MYLVDWNKLVKLLLPTFLRKPVLMAFLQACVKPIATIHSEFLRAKKEWDYRIMHNGQVFSIEKVLNDKFDDSLRRIYISDSIFQDDVYIGNLNNRDQIYLSNDGGTTHIGAAPHYVQQSDFIVHVPALLLILKEIEIINTINMYKIAGKTYILIAQYEQVKNVQ
jgi:hypothetical protein